MNIQAVIFSLSITTVIIGVLVLLKKNHFDVQISLTGILFSLLLSYLVFSNSLSEFSVLGVDAKLKAAVSTPIEKSEIEHTNILGQDALGKNLKLANIFSVPQRVIAIDGDAWMEQEEDTRHENWRRIRNSVYQSLLAGQFQGLVITNKLKEPVGVFSADSFLDLLRIPIENPSVSYEEQDFVLTEKEIIVRSKQTNLFAALKNPIKRVTIEGSTVSARFDTPLSNLLDLISEHDVNLVILTDYRGEYIGIVTASRIQQVILQKLTSKL